MSARNTANVSAKRKRDRSARGEVRPKDAVGTEVVIRCAGLSKTFRDFWMRDRVRAVDTVDLDVFRGEIFGLLGPNGSGKSTTIKMILGLLYPTAGRVAVFGKSPEDVATKKQIGFLPEESSLYPFLNAHETLDYYGCLFGQPRRQRQRRIDMLLEMVGLEAVQNRPVGRYSKGMQRRIGLAQALINDPQLLILDEPTTGLDPIGTRQIKDLILELARRRKTVLLCSHLLADVEDVCDRVAIMFGGRVRATGSVDQLLIQQDATTIHAPALEDAVVQKVDAVLRAYGKRIEKVEKPRQKLESLFLDIVRRAQKEGAATSGARAGGKIAEFLLEGQPRRDAARVPEPSKESDYAASVINQLVEAAEPDNDPVKDVSQLHQHQATTKAEPIVSTEPESMLDSKDDEVNDEVTDMSVIDNLVHPSPVGSEQNIDPASIEFSSVPVDDAEEADGDAMLKEMIAQQYAMDQQAPPETLQPQDTESPANPDSSATDDDNTPTPDESPLSLDDTEGSLLDDRLLEPSEDTPVVNTAPPTSDDLEKPYPFFLEAMDDVPPFVPEKEKDRD